MAPDEPGDLPEGVRRLLLGPVDSFEKLEVILALREATGSAMALDALAARAFADAFRLRPPKDDGENDG